jgi:hypothetical protein
LTLSLLFTAVAPLLEQLKADAIRVCIGFPGVNGVRAYADECLWMVTDDNPEAKHNRQQCTSCLKAAKTKSPHTSQSSQASSVPPAVALHTPIGKRTQQAHSVAYTEVRKRSESRRKMIQRLRLLVQQRFDNSEHFQVRLRDSVQQSIDATQPHHLSGDSKTMQEVQRVWQRMRKDARESTPQEQLKSFMVGMHLLSMLGKVAYKNPQSVLVMPPESRLMKIASSGGHLQDSPGIDMKVIEATAKRLESLCTKNSIELHEVFGVLAVDECNIFGQVAVSRAGEVFGLQKPAGAEWDPTDAKAVDKIAGAPGEYDVFVIRYHIASTTIKFSQIIGYCLVITIHTIKIAHPATNIPCKVCLAPNVLRKRRIYSVICRLYL